MPAKTPTPDEALKVFDQTAEAQRAFDERRLQPGVESPVRTTPPLVLPNDAMVKALMTYTGVTRATARKYYQALTSGPDSPLVTVHVTERGEITGVMDRAKNQWVAPAEAGLTPGTSGWRVPVVSRDGYLLPYTPTTQRKPNPLHPGARVARYDRLKEAFATYEAAAEASEAAYLDKRRAYLAKVDAAYPGLRKVLHRLTAASIEGGERPGHYHFSEMDMLGDGPGAEITLTLGLHTPEAIANLARALGLAVPTPEEQQ